MPEIIGNAGMTEDERAVLALHVSARADGATPGQFLEMLAYIVQDETWKKRGQTLRAMLEALPPHGAGVKASDVLRLIEFTHPHETHNQAKHAELEKMRRVVRRELHEALPENGAIGNGRSSPDNIRPTDYGTSEDYIIRRLRRDHPDLADRVVAREMSANAAAIKAGFRRKTLQIPSDVEGAALALRRHFTDDEIAQLMRLLE